MIFPLKPAFNILKCQSLPFKRMLPGSEWDQGLLMGMQILPIKSALTLQPKQKSKTKSIVSMISVQLVQLAGISRYISTTCTSEHISVMFIHVSHQNSLHNAETWTGENSEKLPLTGSRLDSNSLTASSFSGLPSGALNPGDVCCRSSC